MAKKLTIWNPLRLPWKRKRSASHAQPLALRSLVRKMDALPLNADLGQMVSVVRTFDAHGAERLETLAADIAPGGNPARWTGVDVFRAIDVPAMLSAIRNSAIESRALAVLEVLRNMLVLVPVLLTWWGLRYAAGAYATAVNNPRLRQDSFLLLWQSHFGKPGPYNWTTPTLSDIATWDVGVLALILLMTLLIHLGLNVGQAQRETVARRLEQELHQVVWRASGAVAQSTTLPAAISQFSTASMGLLDELRGYNEQISVLASARQIEVDGLQRFAQDLRQITGGLGQFHQEVAAMLAGARTIADVISNQLAGLTSQQTALSNTLKAVGAQMTLHNQAYGTATAQLATSTGLLSDAADQSIATIGEVARQVAQFAAAFGDMRDQLMREHSTIDTAARALHGSAQVLAHALDRAGSGAVELPGVREALGATPVTAPAQMQSAMTALAAAMQGLVASLGTADARIAGSTTALERATIALATSSQGLNASIDGVNTRLADSAGALSRAADGFQNTLPALRSLNPINLEAAASALARAMASADARQSSATAGIEAAAVALRDLAHSLQSWSNAQIQDGDRPTNVVTLHTRSD